MRNKFLIVGLYFVLTQLTCLAQTNAFFPGEVYFKLADNFQIKLNQYPGDSVNIKEQLPFLTTLVGTFKIISVKGVFYFTLDDQLRRTFRLRCAEEVNLDALVTELAAQPGIQYAEKIPVNTLDYIPNDLGSNALNSQWSLYKINAPAAWNLSLGKPSSVVAIVDNAFQTNHYDLSMLPGWDVADNDSDPNLPNINCAHGTHVAGIAGAKTDNNAGLASIGFGISILPVKASYSGGPGSCVYFIHKGPEGIAWAATNGAKIINCSWGSTGYSTILFNAVNYAWNLGSIVVAAAGNTSLSNPTYPASLPNVVAVASTNINDQKSNFSTFGTWVEVSAPGESILSLLPYNLTGFKSGTSMAAPLVSGLMGLMRSANPGLSNTDLVNCLLSTADNIDAQNPSYIGQLGSGRINALKALQCAQSKTACPPMWNFASPTNDFNGVNWYYEASQSIVASNKVLGSSTITYDAGNYVKLNPGFHAKTNLFFKALIDGCQRTVNTVDRANQEIKIKIFPNPTSGVFAVELSAPAKDVIVLRITDLAGRLVLEKSTKAGNPQQIIQAEYLSAGMYFLQVVEKGRIVGVEKFVKQ